MPLWRCFCLTLRPLFDLRAKSERLMWIYGTGAESFRTEIFMVNPNAFK